MRGRNGGRIYAGEFHAVDCTKQLVRDFLSDQQMQFDLVSCQFAFHYCFESLPQAECMLRNVSENLRVGGYFIGTTPDSNDIMTRLQASGHNKFGNSLFSVTFDEESLEAPQPLFGAKYQFHLEEVVDCPEFLVHFPTLVKLAERFGLMLFGKQRFQNYFQQRKEQEEPKQLLQRMNALEAWGPGCKLVGEEEEYNHLEGKVEGGERVGTLSRDEWEALTIYTVFAFKKIR
jgi:mRNA (guanine-N7-)-methyltransferase